MKSDITSGRHTDATRNAERDGVRCRICGKPSFVSSVICPHAQGHSTYEALPRLYLFCPIIVDMQLQKTNAGRERLKPFRSHQHLTPIYSS